jgi:hypothetical protein
MNDSIRRKERAKKKLFRRVGRTAEWKLLDQEVEELTMKVLQVWEDVVKMLVAFVSEGSGSWETISPRVDSWYTQPAFDLYPGWPTVAAIVSMLIFGLVSRCLSSLASRYLAMFNGADPDTKSID